LERKLPTILLCEIAVLSVFVVLLVSNWPVLHLEAAPVSLFLCAVMLSAWFGGAGPGLECATACCFGCGIFSDVLRRLGKP
jgi:hypothetical protein